MVRRPLGGEEGGSWVWFDALLVEHVFDVDVVVVSGCAVGYLAALVVRAVLLEGVCGPYRRTGGMGVKGEGCGGRVITCDAINWKTENNEMRNRPK